MTFRCFGLLSLALVVVAACSETDAPVTRAPDVDAGTADGQAPAAPDAAADAGCPPSGALTITTMSLPPAHVGKSYRAGIDFRGGILPYTFEITAAKRPPGLVWLAIDRANGELSGTPMGASPPLGFEVRVSDGATATCQQVATRSFEIAVLRCAEGERVDCFQALAGGLACGKGVSLCKDGNPGACESATTPSTDVARCGPRCEACPAIRADKCVDGKCACGTASVCAEGKICCPRGGAALCVDAQSDADNCGACDRKCDAGVNAKGVCAGGVCSSEVTCAAGFGRCDAMQPRSCPTNVRTDVRHCGVCDNACPIPARAAGCEDGKCVCGQDKRVCTGMTEQCCAARAGLPTACTDLSRGTEGPAGVLYRCGSCDTTCFAPLGQGKATCNRVGTRHECGKECTKPWEDCVALGAGRPPESCTVDTKSDRFNCGACNRLCFGPVQGPGVAVCQDGACRIACDPGFTECPILAVSYCADLSSDREHCGQCSAKCATQNAANSTCDVGRCVLECVAGWGDCDGIARGDNGCETQIDTTDNCGACGRKCSTNHIAPRCSAAPGGADPCKDGVCEALWADCDGNKLANGCEADLTSVAHCGGCGNSCYQPAHFKAVCNGDRCEGACEEGWTSCNGTPPDSDGCETNLSNDVENCGQCGMKCPPTGGPIICSYGKCE